MRTVCQFWKQAASYVGHDGLYHAGLRVGVQIASEWDNGLLLRKMPRWRRCREHEQDLRIPDSEVGNVAGKVGNAACGEGGLEMSEATNAN